MAKDFDQGTEGVDLIY